jgi:predicted small lipoprotein YifL
MFKFFTIILLSFQLAACGIKGDLYLPPEEEPEASEPAANEASA